MAASETHLVSRKQEFAVLGIMGASMLVLFLDSLFFPGLVSAEIWGYGFTAIFLAYALLAKDQLVLKLVAFGVATGLAELPADYYLVHVTDSLVYPEGPRLAASPAYMPFSWAVVLIEFGYLAYLITRKLSVWKTGLILAVLGALLVPLYEYWAIHAGWWDYHNTRLLGGIVPAYILLAEGLLMIPIGFMVERLRKGNWLQVPLMAVLEGVVMLISCIIAWSLVG